MWVYSSGYGQSWWGRHGSRHIKELMYAQASQEAKGTGKLQGQAVNLKDFFQLDLPLKGSTASPNRRPSVQIHVPSMCEWVYAGSQTPRPGRGRQ